MTQHNSIINLDYLAAKHAQEVIKEKETDKIEKASDVENAVTKALGVLQENGVYACFVFALSRTKQKDGEKQEGNEKAESIVMKAIVTQMLALLKELNYNVPTVDSLNAQHILSEVAENVTQDLERLLLAKEVLEQMLIYARYGAKARSDNS